MFGTNPIAFAAPQRSEPPIVVDLALSQVARGKILTAAQKGEPIPADWAVDEQGNPTTDAKAALKGALQPIGGAKGAALALMVEVLAVAADRRQLRLRGQLVLRCRGPPPGVGQLLIAIDPGAFAGRDVFLDRIGALARAIETTTAPACRARAASRCARRPPARASPSMPSCSPRCGRWRGIEPASSPSPRPYGERRGEGQQQSPEQASAPRLNRHDAILGEGDGDARAAARRAVDGERAPLAAASARVSGRPRPSPVRDPPLRQPWPRRVGLMPGPVSTTEMRSGPSTS